MRAAASPACAKLDGKDEEARGACGDAFDQPNAITMPHDITAKTQLVGLIGYPVSHSVSPAMHNAAFDALGLDWRYVPLPVAPGHVGDALRGVRALGLRGINVTVPHKQAVLECLDEMSGNSPGATLTDAARAIGAVNTIRVELDGSLLGDNTDARGFIADLREHGVDPAGRRALVVGAGGSARAVVYGLAEAGCAEIVVLNRTLSKGAGVGRGDAAKLSCSQCEDW